MTLSEYKTNKAGEKTFQVWWERHACNITWRVKEVLWLQNGGDFIFSKLFLLVIKPRKKYWYHIYMPHFDDIKSI